MSAARRLPALPVMLLAAVVAYCRTGWSAGEAVAAIGITEAARDVAVAELLELLLLGDSMQAADIVDDSGVGHAMSGCCTASTAALAAAANAPGSASDEAVRIRPLCYLATLTD